MVQSDRRNAVGVVDTSCDDNRLIGSGHNRIVNDLKNRRTGVVDSAAVSGSGGSEIRRDGQAPVAFHPIAVNAQHNFRPTT